MTRPSLPDWVFKMAAGYAERGTCIRRKAGAVALDEYHRVVAMGMNGVPRGFVHCIDKPCGGEADTPGYTDNCMAIHAEANLVANSLAPERIKTVFVTVSPCKQCGLLLANLPNIKTVVYREEYADKRGIEILRRRGIETIHLPEQHPNSIT